MKEKIKLQALEITEQETQILMYKNEIKLQEEEKKDLIAQIGDKGTIKRMRNEKFMTKKEQSKIKSLEKTVDKLRGDIIRNSTLE